MDSVHAAFEKILQEHRDLREMCAQLRDYCTLPRPEIGEKGSHSWASELSLKLVALHDKAFRHFREEEQTGFLQELAEKFPRASDKVARMSKDHEEILSELRSLLHSAMAYSEAKIPETLNLRRAITSMLDRFARHETEETDLVQGLYTDDLGVGD